MKPTNKVVERIAEAFAGDFLTEITDRHVFIGSYIEQVLANRVNLLFHYVEDPSYFGAAIKHMAGEEFIALNSYQPLRSRYFTAAHELWHLSDASEWQVDSFDHERAADRFAAALMLPKETTKEVWDKLNDVYDKQESIIHLADMAQVPYVAVVRRMRELGYRFSDLSEIEDEWVQKRRQLGIAPSPLDQPQKFESFPAYEKAVRKAVEKNQLPLLNAANKLSVFHPDTAKSFQEKAMKLVQEEAGND